MASKAYRCTFEVRGYEIDAFGHVNNANYLNYYEHARWTMLAEEKIDLNSFKSWDRWPVIAGIDVQYLKPIFMGDTITIESRIIEYRRSSMQIEQKIFKGQAEISTAKIRSVFVDGRGKPAALPDDVEAKWKSITAGENP